jgi:hypothetical protein
MGCKSQGEKNIKKYSYRIAAKFSLDISAFPPQAKEYSSVRFTLPLGNLEIDCKIGVLRPYGRESMYVSIVLCRRMAAGG